MSETTDVTDSEDAPEVVLHTQEVSRADQIFCQTLREIVGRKGTGGARKPSKKKRGSASGQAPKGPPTLSETIGKLRTISQVPQVEEAKEFELAPVQAAIDKIDELRATLEGRTRRNSQELKKEEKDEVTKAVNAYEAAVAKMYENIAQRKVNELAAFQDGFNKKILAALGAVDTEKGASADPNGAEWVAANAKKAEVESARATKKGEGSLTQEDVDAAERDIPAAIQTAKTAIGIRLLAEKAVLAQEVATENLATPPPDALPDHVKQLAAAIKTFQAQQATTPLTAAVLTEGRKQKKDLVALHAEMGLRKKNLGDLKGALGEEAGNALGGLDPAAQAIVGDVVKAFPSAAEAATFCKNLGGPRTLEALLTKGCGGDVGMLKTVATKVDPVKLKKVLANGLGEKPGCLAELLKTGSVGDDPDAKGASFQKWIDTLDTHGEKAKTLLGTEGGIGDQPEVFGQMLAVGCGSDPAKFGKIMTGFEAGDINNLNALVKSGGFGKVEAKDGKEVRADCLGELMNTGCGGDPAKLKITLGKLTAPTDIAKVKALVESGGLGANPKALGELLKGADAAETKKAVAAKNGGALTGLEKAGVQGRAADQFTALAGAYSAPEDQKKLAAVLNAGGLGQKPALLSGALQTGCGGDPNKLKALTAGYSATEAKPLEHLNGLVTGSSLGDQPEVFGHLIGAGCDGAPDKLKKFAAGFDTPEKLGKLGNLIDVGGLGGQDTDEPDTLAKIYKTGLGEKPENLVHLDDAFDDTAQVKTIFDAFNTTPPDEPDSGLRLKTVLGSFGKPTAKADNVKIGLLKTKFYDGLDAQSNNSETQTLTNKNGVQTVVNESVLPLEDMLRMAATFERKPYVAPPAPKMTPPPALGTEQAKSEAACAKIDNTLATKQVVAAKEPNALNAFVQAQAAAAAARDAVTKLTTANERKNGADLAGRAYLQDALVYANTNGPAPVPDNSALIAAAGVADNARNAAVLSRNTARQARDNARQKATDSAEAVKRQKADADAKAKLVTTATELRDNLSGPAVQERSEAQNAVAPAEEAERLATEAEERSKGAAAKVQELSKTPIAPENTQAAQALAAAQREATDLAEATRLAKENAAGLRNTEKELRKKAEAAEKKLADANQALQAKQKNATDSAEKAVAFEAAAAAAAEAAKQGEDAVQAIEDALLAFDCRDIASADVKHFCSRHTRGNFPFDDDALSSKTDVEDDLDSGIEYREKRGSRKAKKTTLYPEGTTPADVTAYFEEAMQVLSKSGLIPKKADLLRAAASDNINNRSVDTFVTRTVNLPKAKLEVKVGFQYNIDTGKFTMTQFVPLSPLADGPQLETAEFWDMHAMKDAIGA